jgi:hypothetical protein
VSRNTEVGDEPASALWRVQIRTAVRTLATQFMTLHLQLGAVRMLLAHRGTISDAEVQAAFAELNVVASAEEVVSLTSTDVLFDGLAERLNRTA